ncbi:hypothetical protein [Micromonospora sp. NBRC 101691]|uniref:hypothetical protein n=1 Tax=Micromonospora sp. NBRC 101691 TaxID=3032198 RepID=UPI0024A2BD29|nr:hypothetical protein [Micromonospora sp. NBRC 101691]GLY25219.1 hypothetical protein Misp04_49500 [Micromonospora sp. NBRC 101691]
MTVMEPRILRRPEILGRRDGLILLHNGIIDGPHGLMMVVDVLEEPGSGALRTPAWREPGLPSPLAVTAAGPDGDPVYPKILRGDGGRGYYRMIVTFGLYGRPTRIAPEGAQITVTLDPPGLTSTIAVAGP